MKSMCRLFVLVFALCALCVSACDPGPAVDGNWVQDTLTDGVSNETVTAAENSDDGTQPLPDGGADTGGTMDTGAPSEDVGDDTMGPAVTDTAFIATADDDDVLPATDSVDDGMNCATADTDDIDADTVSADTASESVVTADSAFADSNGVLSDDTCVNTNDAALTDTATEAVDSDSGHENETDTEPVDTSSATDTIVGADTSDDTDAACVPGLVINEVDYDVPGKDTSEFVELYNPTACDMPIAGISLILVNGSNMAEYRRIALSDAGVDVVPADSYLLVRGDALAHATSVPEVVMSLANGFIQNGPDGMALFDENTQTILDAFCYESPMTEVWFDDVDNAFSLVEGDLNPELSDADAEGVSLGRIPNGADSGNSAVDWAVSMATPGAANVSQ